jgi:hypothetical protein
MARQEEDFASELQLLGRLGRWHAHVRHYLGVCARHLSLLEQLPGGVAQAAICSGRVHDSGRRGGQCGGHCAGYAGDAYATPPARSGLLATEAAAEGAEDLVAQSHDCCAEHCGEDNGAKTTSDNRARE